MKRWTTILAVLILVVMAVLPASAAPALPVNGQHYEIHLIGSPKGTSGDLSDGRSIMIPLKNAAKGTPNEIVCEPQEVVYVGDPGLVGQIAEPAGAKLYWQLGPTFDILDRDATDGAATIQIPWVETGSDQMAVDVYVRVHGKPNTCIDIDAWAVDAVYGTYLLAGTLDLNRKTGKATWTNVSDMFDVMWCSTGYVYDTNGNVIGCQDDANGEPVAPVELSVFNSAFSSYFWTLLNNGTRNVEIRLYPRAG